MERENSSGFSWEIKLKELRSRWVENRVEGNPEVFREILQEAKTFGVGDKFREQLLDEMFGLSKED